MPPTGSPSPELTPPLPEVQANNKAELEQALADIKARADALPTEFNALKQGLGRIQQELRDGAADLPPRVLQSFVERCQRLRLELEKTERRYELLKIVDDVLAMLAARPEPKYQWLHQSVLEARQKLDDNGVHTVEYEHEGHQVKDYEGLPVDGLMRFLKEVENEVNAVSPPPADRDVQIAELERKHNHLRDNSLEYFKLKFGDDFDPRRLPWRPGDEQRQHRRTKHEAKLIHDDWRATGNDADNYRKAEKYFDERRDLVFERGRAGGHAHAGELAERLRHDTNVMKIAERVRKVGLTPEDAAAGITDIEQKIEAECAKAMYAEVPEIESTPEAQPLRDKLKEAVRDKLGTGQVLNETADVIVRVAEITGLSKNDVLKLYQQEEESVKNLARENVTKAKSKWRIALRLGASALALGAGFFFPPLAIAAGISLTGANILQTLIEGGMDKKKYEKELKRLQDAMRTGPENAPEGAQKYVHDLVVMIAAKKQEQIDGKLRDTETDLNAARAGYLNKVRDNKGKTDRRDPLYITYEGKLREQENGYMEDVLRYIEKECNIRFA